MSGPRSALFFNDIHLSAWPWLHGCRGRALVTHLWPVCVHLEKTSTETCWNWTLSLSLSVCHCLPLSLCLSPSLPPVSKMPPRPTGVCDRPSPGELASVMNGHLSTLYRLTKSCAYAFMTNFCCFALL